MNVRYFANRLLSDYNYYHRKVNVNNKPEIFAIELTNYCNLRCVMCPRRLMKRKIGFMDFNLFKKIINQIKGYNDYVWLHDMGESLFHPQLELFINYCADNGIKPFLSTNATVLNGKNALKILNSKLDKLLLCLDGATQETYEKIRVNSNFDKVRNNILNFLKLKKKLGKSKPYSVIQIIQMNETEKEIETFKKQWDGLADEVLVKVFSTWAGQIEDIKKISKEEHRYYPFRKERYPCSLLWRNLVVLWDGDVVPCCLDFDGKFVFGNLNEEKLDEIWNSEKIQKMRMEQINNNFDNLLCRECLEWSGDKKDVFYPLSWKMVKKVKSIF